MDLAELTFSQGAGIAPVTPTVPTALWTTQADEPREETATSSHDWAAVLSGVCAEVAGPLTAALERVQALASTGKIDRAGLRALVEEIALARAVGMRGQQLARLASGQMKLSADRVRLTESLQEVLNQRASETQARGIVIKQVLRPAEVVVDASLLHALFNTLLDWSLPLSHTNIEFLSEIKTWPTHARLGCRFAFRAPDVELSAAAKSAALASLDSTTWQLLRQSAESLGLVVERQVKEAYVTLTLEFPRTVNDQLEGLSAIDLDATHATPLGGKSLSGNQVLVVASRRDVRMQVRDAIRHMGLIVDFVGSIEEAREFCRGGLPQAIVFESILRGDRFNELRREVASSGMDLVFIELIEEGNTFEISGFGGLNMARVGRDAIANSLPQALILELSKTR